MTRPTLTRGGGLGLMSRDPGRPGSQTHSHIVTPVLFHRMGAREFSKELSEHSLAEAVEEAGADSRQVAGRPASAVEHGKCPRRRPRALGGP
jgi:hypothetical protein